MPLVCARAVCMTLLALCLGAVASAQLAPVPMPPETRQFDFWVGEWDVTSPDGVRQGTNLIERVSNGRGLLETWTGDPAAGNGAGRSLNAWNAEKRQWQQFWVGGGGEVLELVGGRDGQGRMVLSGQRTVKGQRVIERITWTPNADGSVRQVWDRSSDGGVTWSVIFDGRYVRKGNAPAGTGAGGGGSGGSGSGAHALYYLFW